MINLHERMLPTSAGVEPATSWSPVGRRIQLSHRGRQRSLVMDHLSVPWVILYEPGDINGPTKFVLFRRSLQNPLPESLITFYDMPLMPLAYRLSRGNKIVSEWQNIWSHFSYV